MLYVATCIEFDNTFGLVKCGKEISRDLWKKVKRVHRSAHMNTFLWKTWKNFQIILESYMLCMNIY